MDRRDAEHRIGVADRELGGGRLREVLNRIVPGAIDEELNRQKRWRQRNLSDALDRLLAADERGDEESAQRWRDIVDRWKNVDVEAGERRVFSFVRGIAVGLVMAEDPDALAALRDIYDEWMRET